MQLELILGFTYLVIGAACGGSFGLPSKFVPRDTPWEVLWGPFFLIVTVLMPLPAQWPDCAGRITALRA
jgi:hypothetical protein